MKPFVALTVLLAVASCASVEPDVSDSLQRRVAVFVEDGDCGALQTEFDHATAADDLTYIDDHMRDLGCYN